MQAAVVFDEAEFAEFVHEEIDAGASGADHFGEHFLGNFGQDALELVFFAVAREEQEGAGETLFAGVEELIDEILFDADISGEHEGDEAIGEFVFGVKDANHLGFFDDERGGGSDGGGGSDADGLAGEAAFAEEIARPQDGDDGFFASFVDDGEPDSALLDVEDVSARVALREDCFFPLEFGDFSGDAGGIEKFLRVELAVGLLFWTLGSLFCHRQDPFLTRAAF